MTNESTFFFFVLYSDYPDHTGVIFSLAVSMVTQVVLILKREHREEAG